MSLRMSWASGLVSCALALTSSGSTLSLMESELASPADDSAAFAIPLERTTERSMSAAVTPAAATMANTKLGSRVGSRAFELMRAMETGERAAEEIDYEIERIAGDGPSLTPNQIQLKGRYRLTMVLGHFHDVLSGLQILSVHSLDMDGQNERQLTMYTDRINDADEKSIANSIAVANYIEFNSGRIWSSGKAEYVWQMRRNPSENPYRLRDPEATFAIKDLSNPQVIDPFALLTAENTGDPAEPGVYEIERDGVRSHVELTLKRGSNETFTIKANVRDSDSNRESIKGYTFVLVFEPV